jgi:hypothetical protein
VTVRAGPVGRALPVRASLIGMSESQSPERFDPSGNTEAFQSFERNAAPELPASKARSMGLIVGVAAVVIIVVGVIIALVA